MIEASWLVTIGIGGLAVLVASGFVIAYSISVERLGGRRIIARMTSRTALLAWMAFFALLADRGILLRLDAKPPPLMLAMVAMLVTSALLAFSKVGDTFARGLPLGALVLSQSYRFPLELVMHRAALEAVMPVEMSFKGYNFDIVTGVTAIFVGWLALQGKASRTLILAWNVLGSVLLAVVVSVAIAASPMFHVFGEDPAHVSSFVGKFPFVWLPAVLVTGALFMHIVIFRALRASSSPVPASQPSSSPGPAPSSSPDQGSA